MEKLKTLKEDILTNIRDIMYGVILILTILAMNDGRFSYFESMCILISTLLTIISAVLIYIKRKLI
ncbi:UNVERIFIED_ORG: hypothetical protein B2H93_16715 [Clostridium botulinum]